MAQTIKIMKGCQKDFYSTVKLDGKILDLTGYTATFNMISKGGVVKIDNASAVISNPLLGEIEYNPTAEDVNTEGDYNAYFLLQVAGVCKLAAPTEGFIVKISTNFKD